jgi:hypothetical protein
MTPSTSRWRPGAALLLAAGLALAVGLTGCGRSSSSGTNGSAGGGAAAKPAAGAPDNGQGQDFKNPAETGNAAAAPAPNQAAPNQAGAGGVKPVQLPAIQRSIIYNGSITVRVGNVNDAANQLVNLAIGAGGFIGGDNRTMADGKSTATLTMRLPADRFSRALDDISHVAGGKEESRQVSTQDVTGNVVDLNARIQTQQASVDRVRALLAKAQTIGEVTSLESELSRREADLESLKGQQRSLDDLTALSTVAVTLLGPDAPAPPPPPKKAQGGFLGGLKSGWHAFVVAVGVVLTVLGAALPFVLVLGVPLLLGYRWQRRRRARTVVAEPAAPDGV